MAISLFCLGFIGIASLILVSPPALPHGVEVDPSTLKWIILVNPTIFLLVSVTLGTLLKDAAGVKLPILNRQKGDSLTIIIQSLIYPFLVLTIVASFGVLLIYLGTSWGFDQAYQEIIEGKGLPFLTRLLYGGITEEILMRYGLMTLILWILKEINRPNSLTQFWIANVLTASLFATGHLPALYHEVHSPSIWTLTYLLGGNFWAGICFGYAFWRYGLILAIMTHMGFHLITYFLI